MDQERLQLLLAAEKRGILPDNLKAALAVARERGLVPPLASGMTRTMREAMEDYAANPPTRVSDIPSATDTLLSLAQKPAPEIDMARVNRDVAKAEGVGTAGNAALLGGLNGLTFGLGDEAVGAANAVKSIFTGGGFGDMAEAYAEGRDATRANMDVANEAAPGVGLLSEIAGAVASPVSAGAGLVNAAKTLPGRIATGAGLGTVGAASYGFNDAEGGLLARLAGGRDAAPWGAGFGAAVPALGAALRAGPGKWIAQRKATNKFLEGAPNSAAIKDEATTLYGKLDASNALASAPEVGLLRADILTKMRKEGIMTKSGKFLRPYKDAKAVLDYLDDYAKADMAAPDMLAFRAMVSDLATSNIPKVRRVMTGIKRDVDEFISPKLGPDFASAKDKYARSMRTEVLEKMDDTARDKGASYYTQAGYEHALRQEYKNLLKRIRDGKVQGYSADEIAAMQRIVDGGPVENTLRRLGQVAPKNPLMAGASYGPTGASLAYMFGIPPGAITAGAAGLYGVGRTAGHLAGKMQGKNAGLLRALTGTGQVPPQITADMKPGLLENLMMRLATPATQ